MSKIIEIIISPKGDATVQTRGFIGGDCREASKFLEGALGQRAAERLTGEFYQGQETRQSNQQRT